MFLDMISLLLSRAIVNKLLILEIDEFINLVYSGVKLKENSSIMSDYFYIVTLFLLTKGETWLLHVHSVQSFTPKYQHFRVR